VSAHAEQVRAVLAWNAKEVARHLFATPDYHYIGWLAIPALVDAFWRRDERRFERLLLAATGLALLAVTLAGYGAIDPLRLLLPACLCFWLLAASWLAHVATRFGSNALVTAAPALFALALWLFSPSAAGTSRWALRAWNAYQQHGTRTGLEESFAPAFCEKLDRNAIVASPNPWELYLACGNGGWVLPPDLSDDAVLVRWLDEVPIAYVIVPERAVARYEASPRLTRIASDRAHVLFEVTDAPERTRPWSAPSALAGR
jgi:hypothetical protein